jgi:coenzyme F420-0:L-glutamate ligase/coenzyme F420-1:gamma-L-glutamate ligase
LGGVIGKRLQLVALPGLPLVEAGADLAALISAAGAAAGEALADGDVVVVAQKIVSKAEGCAVDLATVEPSVRARELARQVDKDPRLVELILAESSEVLRHRAGVLVVVHRLGLVLANAGIDGSNVDRQGGAERVLLLPEDPDGTAARLRAAFAKRPGADVAVIISDSVGRAWRQGTVGVALGAAGLPALLDLRGQRDLFGQPLRVSEVGLADEIAAAASLLQGQGNEGAPVVVVRGLDWQGAGQGTAADLIRPKAMDLFR